MGLVTPKMDTGAQRIDSLERLAIFISESGETSTGKLSDPPNIPEALAPTGEADSDPLLAKLRAVRAGQARLAEARRAEEALLADALFWVVRGDAEGPSQQTIDSLRARAAEIGAMLSGEVATDDPEEVESEELPPIDGADLEPFQPPEAFDAEGHRRRLGDLLVQAGVITEAELEDVLAEQLRRPHKHLGALLVEHGFASSHMIARIIASQLRLPYVDLEEEAVDPKATRLVPPSVCYVHGCLPIRSTGSELVLAMEDPLDLVAQHAVEEACGMRVIPVVAAMDDIREAQQEAYGDI